MKKTQKLFLSVFVLGILCSSGTIFSMNKMRKKERRKMERGKMVKTPSSEFIAKLKTSREKFNGTYDEKKKVWKIKRRISEEKKKEPGDGYFEVKRPGNGYSPGSPKSPRKRSKDCCDVCEIRRKKN